jgi:hypothetical protein
MPAVKEFARHANLAQLATADPVPTLVSAAIMEIMALYNRSQNELEQIRVLIERLYLMRGRLQEAGRNDLWGTSETEAAK